MALIQYLTPTQPAGSDGGYTAYKNGGQLAMRARAYPKRVRSQAHNVPMNLISVLSIFWEAPLTNAQRIAWGNYAYHTPLTTAYGAPRYIKGYAHYMRSNRPRLQHGLPRIDAGPTVTGLPAFAPLGVGVAADNSTVTFYFDPSDSWCVEDGAYVMLWIARPRQTAPNRPPEIYRPLGVIAGSSTTPPTSPATFTPNPALPLGSYRVWIRSSLTLADGRLSL